VRPRPRALTARHITWDPVDAATAVAHFSLGANTIAAELHFDGDGDLVDFLSDDRAATSADGQMMPAVRWSTPVSDYTRFGPVRVPRHGDVKWHPETGSWTYGEFELTSITYNVTYPEPVESQLSRDHLDPSTHTRIGVR
jgi:hypothetical protein